jgi:hypothetical protein
MKYSIRFVPILAMMTVAFLSEAEIVVSTPSDGNVTAPTSQGEPLQYGNIRGTVIYYSSRDHRHRPDSDARVILLTTEQTKELYQKMGETSAGPIPANKTWQPWLAGQLRLKETKTDENGSFSFDKVPDGKYLAVIESALPFVATRQRDVLAKVHCRFVKVVAGETTKLFHSFGPQGY